MLGAGVDWLTATMGQGVAEWLLSQSELIEAGYGRPGFAKSELRGILGGEAWRRYEPSVTSERWGKGYESWEASGASGGALFEKLAGKDCRPSRLDVPWDFSVPATVRPLDLVRRCRSWIKGRRIKTGRRGEGGVYTHYVGAQSSDRLLRIYRKDLQDQAWLIEHGPVLRVELVLKREYAAALWALAGDRARFFAAAAGHVRALLGVAPEVSEVPPVVQVRPESVGSQAVFAFVQQQAAMLGVCDRLGVDVFDLARQYQEVRWCPQQRRRQRHRWKMFRGLDGGEVTQRVRELIDRPTQDEAVATRAGGRAFEHPDAPEVG